MELLQKIEIGLTYVFLFVTIGGFAYWISVTTEKPQCPKCESDNIKVKSRRRYLRISALCLYLVSLASLLLYGLYKENDADLTILFGFLVGAIVFSLFAIRGLYFFILGILIKKTVYQCLDCKNKFGESYAISSN